MAGTAAARIDRDGRLRWCNGAFRDVFGPTDGARLDESLDRLLASGDASDPLSRDGLGLLEALRDGGAVALSRADGGRLILALGEGEGGDRLLTAAAEGGGPDGLALVDAIFDNITAAAAVFDADLRMVRWNQRYLELFRLTEDIVRRGAAFEDLVRHALDGGVYGHCDVEATVRERLDLARRREPFAFRLDRADGIRLDVRHAPLPDGAVLRIYTDLSERARAYATQRQILDAIAVPMVVSGLYDGWLHYGNRPADELFGMPLEAMADQVSSLDFYVDLADRRRLVAVMEEHGRVDGFETRFKVAGGRVAWVLLSVRRFRYRGQDAILTCVIDITARKTAEEQLAAQWEMSRTLMEGLAQGVMAFDRDLRMIAWNQRVLDLLQLEPEFVHHLQPLEELTRRVAELGGYGHGDVEEIVAQRMIHVRSPMPRQAERVRRDGLIFFTQTRELPDGGFVTTYTDITDRKRSEAALEAARDEAERALKDLKEAQAHLIQSEKMAALGSLVAGVAHEVNTPVGIALTGASLLAERTKEIMRLFKDGRVRRQDLADYLETADEATQLMLLNIDRAAQLIHSFKQMAVDQASGERRAFDLRDYIIEVLRSLGVRLKRAAHKVELDCPEGLEIDGYPGALSQILTNLVMNSIVHAYAPEQRGTLRIAVICPDGGDVELRYSDDGRGIPEHLQARVFEPFFTTNRSAGGSGLGLNIVYNIATRTLRGRIDLDSAPGRGTVFILRFPRVMAEPGGA